MMRTVFTSAMAGMAAVLFASGATAQSINPALDRQQAETQIVGAITIPLGDSSDQRRTAPRFEIISRSRTADGNSPVIARDNDRRWQERRVGFTLDGSDTVMINGKPAYGPSDRADLNPVETVLVVVGISAVVAVVALAVHADNLSDGPSD